MIEIIILYYISIYSDYLVNRSNSFSIKSVLYARKYWKMMIDIDKYWKIYISQNESYLDNQQETKITLKKEISRILRDHR